MSGDPLARVRASCAEVARRARQVRIEPERALRLARELAAGPPPVAGPDPAHHFHGDEPGTVAFVLTLGAVNFGSGWFPELAKRPGLSGYFTLATALRERFEKEGPYAARDLCGISAVDCARLFGQDLARAPIAELMELQARALRELGAFLRERHGGDFAGPVREAGGSAARLVGLLAAGMPLYRDVARYQELEVSFYKRAQLTAADLEAAFGGRGPGRFRDLHRLTIFADNLVPHVLRCEGALRYAEPLARRIEAGELLPAGSPEEVEIRACAVHAVEGAVCALREEGVATTARALDLALWQRGQDPRLKARPRHRTRTSAY
jgi:hypothetical protein